MTLIVTYPDHGRGAFPSSGGGGTLNSSGSAPGPFYRAPAIGRSNYPGLKGYLAYKNAAPVSINDLAVYMAVKFIQKEVGAVADGLFGRQTMSKVKDWQSRYKLVADGIYGPATAKRMIFNVVEWMFWSSHLPFDASILRGTIKMESYFDAGAVGYVRSRDVGIAQINLDAHPGVTVEKALDPLFAIPWMAKFIESNMIALDWNIDAGIAAYNLGKGGARSWVRAGMPDVWNGTNVRAYINKIKSGGS